MYTEFPPLARAFLQMNCFTEKPALLTTLARPFSQFLRVAEEVRDGRRPLHADAISKKRGELYDWVEERAGVMLESLGSSDKASFS